METILKISKESDLEELDKQFKTADITLIIEFSIDQEMLQMICDKIGGNIVKMELRGRRDEEEEEDEESAYFHDWGEGCGPELDFKHLKFPRLKDLSLLELTLKSIELGKINYPSLESLWVFLLMDPIQKMDTNLPKLKSLKLEHVCICNPTSFGKSLSQSPLLEKFTSYKLHGLRVSLSKAHCFILPSCKEFRMIRSDTLTYIKIWAPRIEIIDMRSCHSLSSIQFLEEVPPKYKKNPLYNFSGPESRFTLSVYYCGIDDVSSLKNNPRVAKLISSSWESEDPVAVKEAFELTSLY